MSVGLVLLLQTPLLFKHAYWLSSAARWMLTGLWPLNQHVCWRFVTQYCMSGSVVLLYLLYLLVWCLTISRVCWYGVSLSTVPAGVVLHIGHTFWFGTSLSAMPVGVTMLAGPFCNSTNILTSWVQTEMGWLQVWCYSYRGAITSDMFANLVPLSDMPACIVQLYQTCMMGSLIQIHVFVKCFSIRQEIWYVKNPPDMPTG